MHDVNALHKKVVNCCSFKAILASSFHVACNLRYEMMTLHVHHYGSTHYERVRVGVGVHALLGSSFLNYVNLYWWQHLCCSSLTMV